MFGTIQTDVYMNYVRLRGRDSRKILAIWCYCTKKQKQTCPTFSASRLRAAVCRISAHSYPSYTSLAFALFIFLSQATAKLFLKLGRTTAYFLALVKPNRVKTCLRQGASNGPLRGRLRRSPLTSRGPGVAASPRPVSASPKTPVHWSVQCTGI